MNVTVHAAEASVEELTGEHHRPGTADWRALTTRERADKTFGQLSVQRSLIPS